MVHYDVLVVDGNPVFAAALCRLLERQGHRAVRAAADRADLEAARAAPRVLLLDADPDPVDVALTAAVVRRAAPGVASLLLIGDAADPPLALEREIGALGCVSRHATGDLLDQAITRALRGQRATPPGAAHRHPPAVHGNGRGGRTNQAPLASLTERELLVLRAMMAGLRSDGIGEHLGISRHTVRTHVQSILGKLSVHTRLEAGMVGLQAGLSPLIRPRPAALSGS